MFAWFGCDGDVGTETEAGGIARTAKGQFARKSAQADGAEDTGAVTAPKKKKKKPVRCIQQHTDVEFRREFPAVCEGLLEKAKEGGVRETKLLLEMGGFGGAKAAKRRGGKSLSAMLLDELKRRQDEREAAMDAAAARGGREASDAGTSKSKDGGAASVSETEKA